MERRRRLVVIPRFRECLGAQRLTQRFDLARVRRATSRRQDGPDRRPIPRRSAEEARRGPSISLITPHASQHVDALRKKEPTAKAPRNRKRFVESVARLGRCSPFAPRVGLPSEDLSETCDVAPTEERDTLRVQRLRAGGIAGFAPNVASGPKGKPQRPEKSVRAKSWEPGVD